MFPFLKSKDRGRNGDRDRLKERETEDSEKRCYEYKAIWIKFIFF